MLQLARRTDRFHTGQLVHFFLIKYTVIAFINDSFLREENACVVDPVLTIQVSLPLLRVWQS